MTTAVQTPPAERLYTTEDLLAMPDDGVRRWLIRGKLREDRGTDMTKRNRHHARLEARIAQLIGNWVDAQPEPRGEVYSGEAGVRLRREPDSSVGVDVVYVGPGVAVSETEDTTMIDGVPTLVVEIPSPSTTQEELTEKLDDYLAAGVPLVWVVEPKRQTITVYRPDREPELFNTHAISADPHLSGFSTPVARVFRR